MHVAGPDLLGGVGAQAPALDHGRAAHADVAGLGGDDHVAAAQQRRIAGKAAAMHDAHHRHLARERGKLAEGVVVQAGDDGLVDIARPPAPALGKQHHREVQLQREGQHAVGLLVVPGALRSGQHHVVVGHDHAARLFLAKQPGVDRADARHHAVGRGVGDEVFHAELALGLHNLRATLVAEALEFGMAETVRLYQRCIRIAHSPDGAA